MSPREPLRNQGLASTGDIGHGTESRRTSRQHQPSKFAREKALSPRASQGLKFKDKGVTADSPVRPPNADLPLKFVKNAGNEYIVQAKHSGNHPQPDQVRLSVGSEDELIRYMSKVPKYLHKGEKLQGNLLNVGVLDWGRLEKWTHNPGKGAVSSSTSNSRSSDRSAGMKPETLACETEKANRSYIDPVHKVDFSPIVRPLKGRVLNLPHIGSSLNSSTNKHDICREKGEAHARESVGLKCEKGKEKYNKQAKHLKDEPLFGDAADLKSTKGKEKYLNQDDTHSIEFPSSKLTTDHVVSEISSQNAEPHNCSEKFERLGLGSSDEHSSCNQESIVLIFPKDFSRPSSSELPQKTSPLRKSAQHNWGSFSDIFSIGDINSDELFSDIPQSCPLNGTVETETDLDVKLDDIIKAQGRDLPVNPSDIPSEQNWSSMKAEAISSTVSKASSGSIGKPPRVSMEMNRDSFRHQRFGFSIGKMTRSLSFRESSSQPPRCSTHMTVKSGPAKTEDCSALSETLNSNKANVNGRAKSSPLRRFLDPLLKSKVANHLKEHPAEVIVKPSVPVGVPGSDKYQASTIKALLHLTVKSGLPLFKFVVDTNNEIFASTVKILSTFCKDDISWLYTFYSVHKVRKKSGRWKNQKVKPCEFGYNVVGQMRVSKPYMPSSCIPKSLEKYKVKESVLCSIDSSKQDAATSEFITGRELAAVIVKLPNETGKFLGADSEFYDFEHEKLPQTVVILPGGDHSLPHEGVPSSLITRWRTEGLCDCGGWDEGCKLRILNDMKEDSKVLLNSRSRLMDIRCDLYDQGEVKQNRPFFRLVPFRDGLFSVEFDAKISSLQAFSICAAVINSKQPTLISDANPATYQVGSMPEFGRTREPVISGEGPEILAPHPPLSPVGRV